MNKSHAMLAAVAFASAAFGQLAVTPSTQNRPSGCHGWWLPRFEQKKALAAAGDAPVVFVGDSITHYWEAEGRGWETWTNRFVGAYKALNCGFSADRTENVLWRLRHGQLDGAKPKAIVLMIGTNNTGHRIADEESPTDVALGVQAIVDELRTRFPEAKIILHPIFPRGDKTTNSDRLRNDLANSAIRLLADGNKVLWCDFNSKLLTPDGTLTREMMPDLLHPGPAGYKIWADALKPYLDYALGISPKKPGPAAPPAPTAIVKGPCKAATPAINKYWFINPKNPRLAKKRAEQCANFEKYYDVVWVGDSITHFWENANGKKTFAEKFGQYKIFNFGFGGDHTENVLWNVLYGGELDGCTARLVTLMIGTNNTWGDSAEDIAAGIKACVEAIRKKQPQAKLLLMPILPREVAKDRGEQKLARKNGEIVMPKQAKVNELIRPLADGKTVIWCDLWPLFIDKDGEVDVTLFADGTHPNAAGYAKWADAVLPVYKEILGK